MNEALETVVSVIRNSPTRDYAIRTVGSLYPSLSVAEKSQLADAAISKAQEPVKPKKAEPLLSAIEPDPPSAVIGIEGIMGLVQVSAEKIVELDTMPVFEWLPLDRLTVDYSYQRNISNTAVNRIRKMVEGFQWADCQPLTVTRSIDGRHAVIDGQHRLFAMVLHPDIERAPCWIVPKVQVTEQAKTFVTVNKNRAGVNGCQLHHARVAAGEPEAILLQSICDTAGVRISKTGGGKQPPGQTAAIDSLKDSLKSYGEAALGGALAMIMITIQDKPRALSGELISAMAGFYRWYRSHEKFSEEHMAQVLERLDLVELNATAKHHMELYRKTKRECLLLALTLRYNQGLHVTKKLEEQPNTSKTSE